MPYTPNTWTDGVTSADHATLSVTETQYTEATKSLGPDLVPAGFVLTGLAATKDASTAFQLNVTAGTAYVLQTDGTTRQRTLGASTPGQFQTSTPSTTYFLDLNPDGTWSWGTSHSGVTNYLPIAQATTDSSHNIKTVTDMRVLTTGLFGSGVLAPTVASVQVAATQTPSLAGTVSGGVTFGVTGLLANSSATGATFDGSSGYISAPTTGLPTGTGAWTLLALCKPVAATNGTNGQLITMGNTSAGQAAFITQASAGGWTIGTWGGAGHDFSGNGTSTAAHTYVVVGTFDGTGLRLYVGDITAGATTPTLFGPFTPTTPALTQVLCMLGGIGGIGVINIFFNGEIQEAAICGTALSQATINSLYTLAATTGGFKAGVLAQNPLRYYRLGEPAGALYAGCSVASTLAPVGADGSNALGRVSAVGGQATVGALGAPAIVAQALDVHVTATTLQTILTYTPSVTGLYRLSGAFNINNGTNGQKPIFEFQATSHGVTNTRFLIGDLVSALSGSNIYNNSGYSVLPTVIHLDAGQTLTVFYEDGANTPNDYVSILVERLA